ncbi:MAG TPA: hypothetical protein VII06_03335 [Chloroflexota bacterium]
MEEYTPLGALASCAPRPPVGVTVVPSGAGRLQVTVSAQVNANTLLNVLSSIQVTGATGATVIDATNFPVSVPATIPLAPSTSSYQLTLLQTITGTAGTTFLTVTDRCGPWTTFAGAGPSGFGTSPGPAGAAAPAATMLPASPGGSPLSAASTPTATPPATAEQAPVCAPRPAVTVATVPAGGGRLRVTVRAAAAAHVSLSALRFGATTNALVDSGDQRGVGSFTVALAPGTREAAFTLERQAAGQAATANLVVVDSCGEWPAVVGGGPSAF